MIMRHATNRLAASLFAAGLAAAPALAGQAGQACEARSGTESASLVELYTSEGCDSCPPADRWLSQLVRGNPSGSLVTLAFHVDYWDYIGWRDRFAAPEHGRRHRERVNATGGRVVYTPQVLLNGRDFRAWRSDSALAQAVAEQKRRPPGAKLGLRLERAGEGWTAALDGQASGAGAQAWLAVYQDGLASEVKAGENRGRRLEHDRVVRRLFGPYAVEADGRIRGTARIDAGVGLDPAPGGVAAFVQRADGEVLQALALPFCPAGA